MSSLATYRLCYKKGKVGYSKNHAAYIQREDGYQSKEEDLVYTESGNMNFNGETVSAKKFWEYADTYERVNSVAYRELELTIPNEFNHEQAKELISNFVKKELGEKYPYTYAIHEAKNELCKMDNGLSQDMSVAKLKHIRTNPEIESLAQVAAVSSLKVNSYYARRRKHAFARNDRREDRFDIQFIALKQGHLLDLGQVLLAADKDYVITPKDFKAERLEEARKNLTAMELMELSMGTSLEEIVARKTGQAFQAEKEVDCSVTAVELPLEVSQSSQEPAHELETVSEGESIPIEERSVEEPKTSLEGGSLDDLVAALQSEPTHAPKERHIVAKLEVDDTLAARRQQLERAEFQEQAFSMMVKEMSQESSENDWTLEQ